MRLEDEVSHVPTILASVLLVASCALIFFALNAPTPVSWAEVFLGVAGSLLVGVILHFYARWERRWIGGRLREVREEIEDDVEQVRAEIGAEVSQVRSDLVLLQDRIGQELQAATSERADLARRAARNMKHEDVQKVLDLAVDRGLLRRHGLVYVMSRDRQLLIVTPTTAPLSPRPITLSVLAGLRGLDVSSGLPRPRSPIAIWTSGEPDAALVELGQELQHSTKYWADFRLDTTTALRAVLEMLGLIIEHQDSGEPPHGMFRGGLIAVVAGGWIISRAGLAHVGRRKFLSVRDLFERSADTVEDVADDPGERDAIRIARAAFQTEFTRMSRRRR